MTNSDSCQSYGMSKRGMVVITLTADPQEVGAHRIVTFEDFTVNGYALAGTLTYANQGQGADSELLEGIRSTGVNELL